MMMTLWGENIYIMHTIYNGTQQEQIIPFSWSGDKNGTKWLPRPHEGQQVQTPLCSGARLFPSGVGDWLDIEVGVSSDTSVLSDFLGQILLVCFPLQWAFPIL